jgi:uncharacterized protein YbjQ (UPF0145 family)
MALNEDIPNPKEWYYKDTSYRTHGPFSINEMKEALSVGKIDEFTPVKSVAMSGFLSLKNTNIYEYLRMDRDPQEIWEEVNKDEINKVVLTTAPTLEGYKIIETLEVITAECVFGMNIFRDIFASFTDLFGGRSEASQKILRDARRTCTYELKREAHSLGANAVIAVNLAYSEFSGKEKSMLFLVASGTAVKVEKVQP